MKNCLIISRHAPYGTSFGKEGLDAALMASALTQVSCLFMDAGIFQLLRNQAPESLHIKDYSRVFELLEQYDVKQVYVSSIAMADHAISEGDLVIPVQLADAQMMQNLIEQHQFILTF